MPSTRKKVIKTVYKDEGDSETENSVGDFSDSGSEAEIPDAPTSDEEEEEISGPSADEFDEKSKKKGPKSKAVKKTKFAKEFIKKINRQTSAGNDEVITASVPLFTVRDLTEADKLLPSFLNLSESDSSDDESPKAPAPISSSLPFRYNPDTDSEKETKVEYKDVWSQNVKDNSEEVAKKTFMELEQHKNQIEETKATLLNYKASSQSQGTESDVKDLLALGEEVLPESEQTIVKKSKKGRKARDDSDSEMEDWEEVKEAKMIPQQGLQLVVDFPDAACRKSKKIDVEMMMKRKINRVKKEYQVYMHKVHVLCWIGHGNYVSRVLNDQEVLAAALSLVPSKDCYPGERVDMKYLEQITTWYKDKLTLKQDKYEEKFRPKAPPLKQILIGQTKTRTVTAKKYLVFIFVSMLRALGLQCRVMFNFTTLPIKPPTSELCSLSNKPKDENKPATEKGKERKARKSSSDKNKSKGKISQVDGNDDSFSSDDDTDYDNMQLDGNDDALIAKTRKTRATRAKKNPSAPNNDEEDVSPPKRARRSPSPRNQKITMKSEVNVDKKVEPEKRKRSTRQNVSEVQSMETGVTKDVKVRNPSTQVPKTVKKVEVNDKSVKVEPEKSKRAMRQNVAEDEKIETGVTNDVKAGSSSLKKDKIVEAHGDKGKIEPEKRKRTTRQNVAKDKKIETGVSKDAKAPQRRSPSRRQNKVDEGNTTKTEKKYTDVPGTSSTLPNTPKSKTAHTITTNRSSRSNENSQAVDKDDKNRIDKMDIDELDTTQKPSTPKPKTTNATTAKTQRSNNPPEQKKLNPPIITVTQSDDTSSKYFGNEKTKKLSLSRNRSQTANPSSTQQTKEKVNEKETKPKPRTKSAPGISVETSKYFEEKTSVVKKRRNTKQKDSQEDQLRVSHRDLMAKNKAKSKNDVTGDLVDIIKKRVKEAKEDTKRGKVKVKPENSDEDSDNLPEEPKGRKSDSDDDFKPCKLSPKPSGSSKKIDRRVLSSDSEELPKNKCDVWCEVFVEELEQWIAVDVIRAKVHCTNELYNRATHPVCYVVGWDNNNYLKDLTRRYVPHWNTVTRKQRAGSTWWETAVRPWLGPNNARDREEDEQLDRMQLDAPLPKSIAEYKNHPLYALKRHLLKFEAIYPPDAATLGFVRGEAVYARDCVYVCRSRDTWLKEAKVVRLGEQPYKIVKARPKWDRLSNKLITDKPLEVFGPWQTMDYEPPVAENGIVPRNAYGNVELFKDCMLPKGTVHIKLAGLNRVAKKLNIDCAPAMTGFDFNGGWSHPVYDGFVVCKEFEQIVTDAWVKDQEEQERREQEKFETRVYGNWKRLIKGLLIRERLKNKYGFEEPPPAPDKKKKGPKLVVKKK